MRGYNLSDKPKRVQDYNVSLQGQKQNEKKEKRKKRKKRKKEKKKKVILCTPQSLLNDKGFLLLWDFLHETKNQKDKKWKELEEGDGGKENEEKIPMMNCMICNLVMCCFHHTFSPFSVR